MTPETIVVITIASVIFACAVIIPRVLRFLYFLKQKNNPSQQDIIFHKIMKLLKDDPDRWVITEYGSDFNYAPNQLKLSDHGSSVSCSWPTSIYFNRHNSKRLKDEFKKLRTNHSESKDNFLIGYLNDEINLKYRMNPKYIKTISNELTLWLKTEIEGKSYLDITHGYVWFSDKADLIACKMRWSKDK